MRYHLIKNKLLSTLLVFALLFTLLPATAWAAAATGTASGTAGYNNIAVSLSGASQFAADAAVQNTSNWELIPTGGTQTILGITKHDPQYVSIVLSAPIQAGQTFTIDAATEVFAPGTDMFPSPLDVNITVPTPATGTAAVTAGSKDIAVTLTGGTFGSESAVETKSFWMLGGDSASGNPIASVTYVDSTHATVTLTNNIGASDTYTITATQFVFVNAAIAPFVSPLSVTVEPAAEPLTLIGAAVTAGGGVGLTFNKELSPTDLATKVATGFSITGLEETPKTITNVTLHSASGGTNNFIQLYLNPTVKGGEAAGLQYTPSGVQSLDGDVLAAIAAMDIENYLPHPDLVTTAPPAATVGSAYNHTLTASGGTGPYTFSIDGGNLPSGLTMSSTGVISGTPTVAASYTFFIMVQDANQAIDIEGFNITVNAPSANACAIGGTEYATLDAALATLVDNTPATITLLKDAPDCNGIYLSRKKLTLDLNGKELTIQNSAGIGIEMQLLSELNITGSGILNIDAQMAGLSMNQSKFIASENVTVEINSDTNLGLYTDTACTVNLHGDVSGAAGGIYTSTDNTITVSGTATATGSGQGHAVHLNNTGNTVQVGSAIVSSGTGTGVHIGESSGGTVTVGSAGAPGQIIGKGYGIWVRMGITPATVTVYGDVEGASHGISASDDSTITVYGNVKSTAVASGHYGVYCFANSDPSNITINGNVEGDNGVYVHGAQSELTVNGNVTANGSVAANNAGVRASYSKLYISGNVLANNCIGAHSFESSEIVIDGTITAAKYIQVKYADKTIADIDAVSSKADYRQYSSADAFVWVKSAIPSDKVCEIGGTQYATLDAALATINEGETKTITLLKNIDYDKGITLINKKITFALNGYTLNVVSSIEGEPALAVFSGGCVYLSGAGALNVTGPARSYGVTVASNTTTSVVTVTKATGIGTESKAAHAYNKASLTVLGDVTATGISSFGVHAQTGAVVEVRGNVSADNQGVCVSDATAKVAGNVQSNGNDLIGNPEGIGVNVYDGVAEIGGDVTANRVGAMIYAGGSITIDGTLNAPDYIQFADDAPTAIGGYLAVTTKPGYRTYQHATVGTVWVKGETPAITYALTVTNGTGGGSYAKDAVVAITANTAPSGQRFKEWSITPSVTFADSTNKNSQTAKFIMPAQPVAATAIYEVLPASEYAIIVQNDGNGTAGANFNSAAEGAEITLTATPNSGYRFIEWKVISGGVTIINNKFSMLDSNVTVKAIFEPVPAASYNVAVNGSYAGTSGAGSYTQGSTVTVHAGIRSSYSFIGWTSSDGVVLANVGSATTTFTMPAKNVIVTANWSYNGGGDSTPSGGSGTTTPKYEASVSSGSGSVYVEAKVNTNNASAELTPAQAAKGKDISVTMPKIPDVKSYTLGIPVPSLSDVSGNGSVTLNTDAGNITLPSNMLTGTDTASGSKAQISIGTVKPGDLPMDAQDKVGTRPIVSLSMSIDGKAVAWNNPNAPVTVSIPYTPTAEELKNPDRITVWYIDGSGNLVEMRDTKYDPATGTVVFQTTHFSFYAVGYKAPATSAKFTDVLPGAWYYDAVTFIAEKGITTGTGGGKFSPEATLTRGQFIVMLMKAYGIEVEKNPTDNFSDAGDTYYTGYLATAKVKGISSGIGNNRFGPEQAITRQEMFTLLHNALKLLNKLPTGDNGKTIANFTDSGSVANWATEALTALVKSGTVSGSGNRLDPTATTTRVQMAQVLYNLLGK